MSGLDLQSVVVWAPARSVLYFFRYFGVYWVSGRQI